MLLRASVSTKGHGLGIHPGNDERNPCPGMESIEPTSGDLDLSVCFPIAETGESNKTKGRSKLVYYKPPIPKTKLTRALLGDNVCDERKLQLDLDKLTSIQKKAELRRDRHKLTFSQTQERKKHVWRREDSQQIQRLNLPQLHHGNRALQSASLTKIYEPPKNFGQPVFTVPLPPVLVGEDERRIVEHHEKIFLTRLPTILKLSSRQQRRYDRYKGVKLLQREATEDSRFTDLCNSLSETKDESQSKRTRRQFFITRASTLY